MAAVDRITKRWIKSEADERAVAAGCRFSLERAEHVADFARLYCRHSKGQFHGQPFELLPWQRDELMFPLFGWVGPDGKRRYRKSFVFLPKKNGKSALASVVGLYMLVGDCEHGAHVYSAATDAAQASIVHNEAINMVDASPELSAALKVNRSTRHITCHETKSYYAALSAIGQSKEGLDAHCIIADELHVWKGRALWDALKYAFSSAARTQPLLFMITTAGDDVTSVCYEQYRYAKSLLSGEAYDERYFAYVREAEPEDDWKDPATWAKANPSLGSTLRVDDFKADVEEAERLPSTIPSLLRYRFNIWKTSTNPWLRETDWRRCRRPFITENDLAGRECYGGLDLSKVEDMTSFVLTFPLGRGRFGWLPYFWLPEGVVNAPGAPEYLQTWAAAGLLRLTSGDVCNYDEVEADIADLAKRFDIRRFAFDEYNAEQITQRLDVVHGIERVAFRQNVMTFTGPTTEAERLVVAGKLWHPGNAILSWEAGHVEVWTDRSGNKRPVKPKHGDRRKIDGIVAGIMGLGLALEGAAAEGSAGIVWST